MAKQTITIGFPSQEIKDEAIEAICRRNGYNGSNEDAAAKEKFLVTHVGKLIKADLLAERTTQAARAAQKKVVDEGNSLTIG